MKVRWTTPCAGGCGTVLVVGTYAERRHRSLWCPSCYVRHRGRCGACRDHDGEKVRREPALAGQPPLW